MADEKTTPIEDDYGTFTTFHITTSEGTDVEMAVLEEFEYEKKTYVAAALVEGDTINEDGVYIYEASVKDGELVATQITDKKVYESVVNAYMDIV